MLDLKMMLMKLAEKVIFVTEQKTGPTTTCAANKNSNIRIPIAKDGYTAIGIVGIDIRNGGLSIINYNFASATEVTIWVKNTTTASITIVPFVTILYQKA